MLVIKMIRYCFNSGTFLLLCMFLLAHQRSVMMKVKNSGDVMLCSNSTLGCVVTTCTMKGQNSIPCHALLLGTSSFKFILSVHN